jgi:hypothetical protein
MTTSLHQRADIQTLQMGCKAARLQGCKAARNDIFVGHVLEMVYELAISRPIAI